MPPVAYCDYNNAGTPWEMQINGVTPVKKAVNTMGTFINTSECGNRNNAFQNQIIKNQYGENTGFGIDEDMPELDPVTPTHSQALTSRRNIERVDDEVEISKLYEPYQSNKVKRIPNYMGVDQGVSYDEYVNDQRGGYLDIPRSYINSYIRPYAQENFSNMSDIMSNDKELIFLYIILIIFCILFVGQLTDLIKVLYKVS
jgi:hypothetical protein